MLFRSASTCEGFAVAAARVKEVQVEWQSPSGKLEAFQVRPTANLGEPA